MNLVHRSIGCVIERRPDYRWIPPRPDTLREPVMKYARTTDHVLRYLFRFGIRFRLSKLSIDRRTDRALAGDRSPAFHFDSEVQ